MDVLNKSQRTYCMSQIKGGNTKIEVKLRKFLWRNGLKGYRIKSSLYGKPDIVYNKYKLAIFCDGCFWHKCPKCYKSPKTNNEFWDNKINGNVKRDKLVNSKLNTNGWEVIRFWEHEIHESIDICYDKIITKLNN